MMMTPHILCEIHTLKGGPYQLAVLVSGTTARLTAVHLVPVNKILPN